MYDFFQRPLNISIEPTLTAEEIQTIALEAVRRHIEANYGRSADRPTVRPAKEYGPYLDVLVDDFLLQVLVWRVPLESPRQGEGEAGTQPQPKRVPGPWDGAFDAHTGQFVYTGAMMDPISDSWVMTTFEGQELELTYPVRREGGHYFIRLDYVRGFGAQVTQQGDDMWGITRPGLTVKVRTDQPTAEVNGRSERLPASVRLWEGAVYVPVSLFGRITDLEAKYDAEDNVLDFRLAAGLRERGAQQ
jgi:hypothetical protein